MGVSHPEYRLIAIPPEDAREEDCYAMCRAAAAGGATAVQVRLKSRPACDVLRVVERLCRDLSIPVYVNDRADVARIAGNRGAHIGADDLAPASIRQVLPRPFRIGVSVGSVAEAGGVRDADADYWSIGPFARSRTKRDAGTPLGVEGFRGLARLAPPSMPVVAIGGVGLSNIAEVVQAGADGVAVISAVFFDADVERATRRLSDALAQHR